MRLEYALVRKLSVHEIRSLGFDWTGYPLIKEYCVMEDGEVDLARTIEGMRSSRAYYRRQLDQAFSFKMRTGADYSDFSDRFDDNARMNRELGQAIAYLEQMIEAVEKS
jgi:hypothetical protein